MPAFIKLVCENKLWQAEVKENTPATVEYQWGTISGKLQTLVNQFTSGKNIGKKNETTAYEQAVVEAKAKVNKKIMEGYEVEEVAGEATFWQLKSGLNSPLPMLAKEWKEHYNKMPSIALVQPKLDGIRCICNVSTGEMFSRKGERILSSPHIQQQVLQAGSLAKKIGIEWLDGELYIHGMEFQTITSIVRKQKNGLHESYKDIQYHVYDCITADRSLDNGSRLQLLNSYFIQSGKLLQNIISVETLRCDIDSVGKQHQRYVARGYEGIMIRDPSTPYREDKRSDKLLKLKDFDQEEFEVLGVEKEKSEDTLGAFLLKTKEGNEFTSCPSFSDAQKKEIWDTQDTYNWSKWVATVKFQGLSIEGKPRFNTTLGLRFDADR